MASNPVIQTQQPSEQAILQELGAAVASQLSLSGLLSHLARLLNQAVDGTSTHICRCEPDTKSSTILAQYQSPCVDAEAHEPVLPTDHLASNSMFLATLMVGQPWLHYVDAPDRPTGDPDHGSHRAGQTVLFIPLQVQGEIIGFVEVRESRQFTPEEITLCQAISQIAAVAMENIHLRERMQREMAQRHQAEEEASQLSQEAEKQVAERTTQLTQINTELVRQINATKQSEAKLLQRNRELLALHSAAAATTASLDLHFVLETLTWEMSNLLDIEGCVIYEWDKEADTLSAIVGYDNTGRADQPLTGQIYRPADYPLKERALLERYTQQLTLSQPDADPAEFARMERVGIKTVLILPMVFQDRVVGLAEMQDSRTERTFTDHEISLAQFLTTQAAGAVENARLYERAQQEITERMRIEVQIKTSLKEKEVLLKEIHHRVKNNLQVVSSLLNLQSQSVEDQAALDVLRESRNRIRSMALIHERLYRSENLGAIDFGVYIQDLVAHLVRSYRSHLGRIDLRIQAEGVFLGVNAAVPCGLITNELISNALKHAFPNDTRGEIRVELERGDNGQVSMVIGDDGVGFPDNVDFRNTESLGMQLVTTLINQLDGSIELHTEAGTEFRIIFAAA